MKSLLKNNIVIEISENFTYIDGAWQTPDIRLGEHTDPDLIVVDANQDALIGKLFHEGTYQLILPTNNDRNSLIQKIDSDVDNIYASVQGNRGPEYTLAEQEAGAFKAANYTGTVPSSVASWATVKSATSTWAANNILTTAAMWRGAMSIIRTKRLEHKELTRTTSDLDSVQTSWNTFVKTIRTQLGV